MFTKNRDDEPVSGASTPQETVRSSASKPATRAVGSAASIICGDMSVNGSISSEGALQIDGLVDGDVSAADITIGAGGKVIGEVKADAVKVKGEVRGSIRARKIELETGAKVQGDILHSTLSIQPNALFEGQVKHDEDPLKDAAPRAASTASDRAPKQGQSTTSAESGKTTSSSSTQAASDSSASKPQQQSQRVS
ncbi:polymer-forming cytoskeletal protein [Henriciella sp.]|uniref:bactofilin family protein n=1 Tax=Henriciella sp. TaxID=1968823 RepID=UPI002636FCF8|nr:polymer-forming cytoskeletal protein [Henriciella sp.]